MSRSFWGFSSRFPSTVLDSVLLGALAHRKYNSRIVHLSTRWIWPIYGHCVCIYSRCVAVRAIDRPVELIRNSCPGLSGQDAFSCGQVSEYCDRFVTDDTKLRIAMRLRWQGADGKLCAKGTLR